MKYLLKEVADIAGGDLIINNNNDPCSQVLTDTRSVVHNGTRGIFFAINGKNRDGHSFIPAAWQKGVRNFVIEKKDVFDQLSVDIKKTSSVLLCCNCLRSLQKLAEFHRQRFDMPVLAITGSNGKTILKEWLFMLLFREKSIFRSPKSYNSQLGVPLSVLGLSDNFNLGIFEAGISQPGEMEKLEKMIRPDTGIFTNIGQAHQENFHSMEEKISEKLILFKNSSRLIYRSDYHEMHRIISEKKNNGYFGKNIELVCWSTEKEADFRIITITKRKYDTLIKAVFKGNELNARIPFTDDASVENTIHCWLYLLLLDIPVEDGIERLMHLVPVEMRLELKEGINNCTLVNDSYNSDINSLSIALDFLNQQNQHHKKTLVLSDIFQSGMDIKDLYRKVADILELKGLDRLIGIGTDISDQASVFTMKSCFYKNTEEFLASPEAENFRDEAILIKGSRPFCFERITAVLQKKVHHTVLELNLHSLVSNLNIYRSLLKPETKIMAMVKAFSYGSGSYEIANILQFNHIDYLAVAYADEGVELRRNGITLPVMVMNPDRESLPVIFNNLLEPEIYSLKLLEGLVDFIRNHNTGKQYPVHVKVDSGMHRLGFGPDEIQPMLEMIKKHPEIKVLSVFSHLAAADNSEDNLFTRRQLILFKKLSDRIADGLGYHPDRHLLNSAGIARFPYAQFEMVRLGLGLYGIDTTGLLQDRLEPIGTFKTIISQLRDIEEGESIGYGTHAVMKKKSRIGVIGVGYADGFNRLLGNGNGNVLVRGVEVPVVGNVCMDMSFIDVTCLDVYEGDEVVIFGRDMSIQKMAEQLNTIPYEILTGVSQRVKRIYYKE